jgi:RimJ/RimL family protein N-acetyltransferase
MEKSGMRREAHFRQHLLRQNGEWLGRVFHVVLAEEYVGRAASPISG